jgi:hypothetical protein
MTIDEAGAITLQREAGRTSDQRGCQLLRNGGRLCHDLRLVNQAALGASQRPMFEAETRRHAVLNCQAGLASGTAERLGEARWRFGR